MTQLTKRQQNLMKSGDGWFDYSMQGLVIHRQPTWDEWEKLGHALAVMEQSISLFIGDWILIGEQSFGERYSQLVDLFGREYSYGHVSNCAYVCRKVPMERRLEGLSFSHYKAVAPLPPEKQVEWQEKALDNEWVATDLRREINPPEPPDPDKVIPRIVGDIREMTGDENVDLHTGEVTLLERAVDNLLRTRKMRRARLDREYYGRE